MSMTPDELVTRNDLAKMQESILKAMHAMMHPADPYLSFEQAVVYLKTTERSLADRVRSREIPTSRTERSRSSSAKTWTHTWNPGV